MENKKVVDMSIIKSLRELEKLGATDLFKKQVQNLLNHAPSYVEQIEKSLKNHHKKDVDGYAKALNLDAASVGAMKLHAVCSELISSPLETNNAQVIEIIKNIKEIIRETESELKQLIAS